MPAHPCVGSDGGGFVVDHTVKLELDHVAVRHATEAGGHDAILIKDERGGRLQNVKTLGQVRAVREINVEVRHTHAGIGNITQFPVHVGASGTEISAELQDGCPLAECVFAHEFGPNDLGRKPAACTALQKADCEANSDRQNEQYGDADQRMQDSHKERTYRE